MKGLTNKNISRISAVLLSGSATAIKSFSILLNSWLVIHFVTLELWGAFTLFLITTNFIGHFISFGNKDYLIREFSKNPAQHRLVWNKLFWNRIPLVAISLVFLFFTGWSVGYIFLSAIWIVFLFIQQSFDSLNLFTKNFRFPFLIELICSAVIALLILMFHFNLDLFNLVLLFTIMQGAKGIVQLYFYRSYLRKPELDTKFIRSIGELLPFFAVGFGGLLLDKADLFCVSIYLPDKLRGSYQILSGLSGIGLVAVSSFLTPFTKNVFRISHKSHIKLHKKYLVFGFFFTVLFILVAYVFLTYLFQLHFSYFVYLSLFFSQLFFIFYFPFLILFTKLNWQKPAVVIILASGTSNLLLSFILTPKYHLEGAIAASALGHLVLSLSQLIYYKINYSNDKCNNLNLQ